MLSLTGRRTRKITGTIAAAWALLAIALSIYSLVSPLPGPLMPVRTSIISGVAVVHAVSENAAQAGIEVGDQLISVGGRPAIQVLWEHDLIEGLANDYLFLKPDGTERRVVLEPVSLEDVEETNDVLLHLGLLLVSSLYLVIAITVWWSRQASAEAWALLLYCSTMSVLLSTAIRVDMIPWATSRILITLPFLGATTFHLFTTYPVEPRWVAKRPRIRLVPYALACGLSIAVVSQSAMKFSPNLIAGTLSLIHI